jgi:sugar lactone lactonase YvrE
VYVLDGRGVDHLRLFDHKGDYVRTIHPFPADKLDGVVGLERRVAPQTGQELPRKIGYTQATFLSSGSSAIVADRYHPGEGFAASAMAVQGQRIALAHKYVNRLSSDATSGGLPLRGAHVGFKWRWHKQTFDIGPSSAAFSPDGTWLYLTGYVWKHGSYGGGGNCRHGVHRVAFGKDDPPQVFAGDMALDGNGRDNSHFTVPNSVACDARGRVYIADFMNDRVQIFGPDGAHLKTIRTRKPTKVQIDPRTQQIYVFSWFVGSGIAHHLYREYGVEWDSLRRMPATLTQFGPLEKPEKKTTWRLPLAEIGLSRFVMGQYYHAELDFWADELTLWTVGRKRRPDRETVQAWGKITIEKVAADPWLGAGITLFAEKNGKWVLTRDFAEEARKAIVRVKPADNAIQRLYVNEMNHKLYVLEHLGASKSHGELLEIDPDTGAIQPVKLPFRAEDICFDHAGRIYLRTDKEVVRYDPSTWREVPWDYGERRQRVSFGGQPSGPAVSALPIPGARPMWFHQYGMWVSPRGHLAVSCVNRFEQEERVPASWKADYDISGGKRYQPRLFPGRARHQEIHIWDQHGHLICEDAVPGLGIFHGLAIDRDDNIYVMSQGTRNFGEAPYPNRQTGTLIKFRARGRTWGDVQVISSTRNVTKRYVPFAPMPLPEHSFPQRPPDTVGRGESGSAWMTGAEWFYGGVGIVGAGCICWHTRFYMDYFARCFAPEPDLYSVAVLDTNGNLILRVGQFGNVDDPGIALFYPAYVAADTDRRLFIADFGNARIVSVKLGYHTEQRLALRDVPEAGSPGGNRQRREQ